MRNNKGYSLVELLISIAIFSFVMVGIISIMNTTSVFYRGGQQEVRLQEEAQVALNQIEELLIDVDDRIVAVNDTAGSREYKVYKDGISYGLKQEGDQLKYKKIGASGDSGWVLMAEGITGFEIDGIDYYGGPDRNVGDNRVSVNVGVKSGKYEYTARKDVYFRNAIENVTSHTIPQSTSGGGASASTEYDYKYTIRRGEKVNLFAEFDIVSDAILTSGSSLQVTQYFDLVYTTNDTTGITEYIVTTKGVLSSFANTVGEMSKLGVSGKDSKGNDVNVLFLVDAVEPVIDVPVMQFTVSSPTNAGSPKWIEFKGIDLRGYSNPTYNLVFFGDSNGNGTYESGEEIGGTSVGVNFGNPVNPYSNNGKFTLGVRTCNNTGYAVVYQHNDKIEDAGKAFLQTEPKKYFYIKIKVGGQFIDKDRIVLRALPHGAANGFN